jgi:hypothetical protein
MQKRGRKSASNGEQAQAAPSPADPSGDDDGVKTRSSRRIKRDLGKWTEGADLYRDYEKILEKLMAHRNAWPFNQPVDPVALNIPDYLDVVKQPMDLGTVLKNLDAGELTSPLCSSFFVILTPPRSHCLMCVWCVVWRVCVCGVSIRRV